MSHRDRTETDVIADVIVELVIHGVIAKEQVVGVTRILGVTVGDVKDRSDARDRRGTYLRPSIIGGPAPRPPKPTREPIRPPTRGRATRTDNRGLVWLHCGKCPPDSLDDLVAHEALGIVDEIAKRWWALTDPEAFAASGLVDDMADDPRALDLDDFADHNPGHWAPASRFNPAGGNKRGAYCYAGRRRYGRERYVSTKALEAMSTAGIALVLNEDSALVGVACKACGVEFRAGDDVVGEATMFHGRCAPAELGD